MGSGAVGGGGPSAVVMTDVPAVEVLLDGGGARTDVSMPPEPTVAEAGPVADGVAGSDVSAGPATDETGAGPTEETGTVTGPGPTGATGP